MNGFKKKKLSLNRTFGQRLKTQRKRKKNSLSQAEEETKIRANYLKALEEENLADLPGEVYTLGFLKKYAQYLKLNVSSVEAQYKREREVLKKMGKGQEGLRKFAPPRHLSTVKFYLTPKMMAIVASVILILGLLGYIVYEVNQFTKAPDLFLLSPSSEGIVKADKINVVGRTNPGVELFINNNLIPLDKDGNFVQEIKLTIGINFIEIRSKNRIGKETVEVIKVLAEY